MSSELVQITAVSVDVEADERGNVAAVGITTNGQSIALEINVN